MNKLPNITQEELDNEMKYTQHILGRLLVNNIFNFENSFKILEERKYQYLIINIDIHSTILYPDYGGLAKKYYPLAKETLIKLSNDDNFKLVLYTCSYPHEIIDYIDFFKKDDIIFDEINKYSVENTKHGFFENKPYFNIILDDKAGFIPEYDWVMVDWVLNKYKKLN